MFKTMTYQKTSASVPPCPEQHDLYTASSYTAPLKSMSSIQFERILMECYALSSLCFQTNHGFPDLVACSLLSPYPFLFLQQSHSPCLLPPQNGSLCGNPPPSKNSQCNTAGCDQWRKDVQWSSAFTFPQHWITLFEIYLPVIRLK